MAPRRECGTLGGMSRIAVLLVAAALPALAAAAPEKVSIPAGAHSSAPAGRDAAKRPAVVMMHGCGGAFGRDGTPNARHRMWGEYLASLGYVALLVDGFTPRGLREICTQKFADRTIRERDRVGDALAALEWLAGRGDVDRERMALLGWSHGGGTVLAAAGRLAGPRPLAAAVVSFYPGCTARARAADKFHAAVPVLLLIGEADDWTPAAPCKALAEAVAARGEPMQIVTYPGAYHDFDHPGLRGKRVRPEVPNGVRPGEGVTTAPDPAAREDAKVRVRDFLQRTLRPRELAADASPGG